MPTVAVMEVPSSSWFVERFRRTPLSSGRHVRSFNIRNIQVKPYGMRRHHPRLRIALDTEEVTRLAPLLGAITAPCSASASCPSPHLLQPSVDGRLAPALQIGLRRLVKPWYQTPAFAVFRDNTRLAAMPRLLVEHRGCVRRVRFLHLVRLSRRRRLVVCGQESSLEG